MPGVVRYRRRLAVEGSLAGGVIHRERLPAPDGGHAGRWKVLPRVYRRAGEASGLLLL
jgi:hypothetical protein